MPISDDWDFDYPNTVLQHIDGVLSYDTGAGRQAAVGEYVYGATTGAFGKVIAVTGNTTSGTLTLTNVNGLFDTNELLEVASELGFDGVTLTPGGSGIRGLKRGDTISGQTSGSTIDVIEVEYNTDGLGGGTIYGQNMSAAFTNDELLDNDTTGATDIGDANGVGTDNDAALTTTLVNGTLAVPGTVNTNDSVVIHYDAGTVAIPEQAIVEDAVTGASGLVEQVTGVLATGSVRIVDYDSSGGVFTDGNTLRADQVLQYQNQVAGQVFNVGDVVVGGTSSATGRVILDTGTHLIFADESGTWTTTEDLNVGGTKIAEANGTNTVLNLATLNLPATPGGIRTEQRPTSAGGSAGQGGIYAATDSLNIVRKLNSVYTLSQDTFDELLQMDDDEAMDAAFKGFAYSLVFGWVLGQGSDRFLRQGALIDTTGAEVWANPQTLGAQNKITDTAFLLDTTQPFRQPQLYVEQNGEKVVPWWLEGNIDILLRVRTRQDTRFIIPATPTLGQLINGGDPQVGGGYAVLNREFYTSTYDTTEVDGSAGVVNTVALGTADDTAADRNPQGTHTFAWDAGSAATLLVGEEFFTVAGNDQKVGIVVAQTGDAGATGTVEYVLKSGAQFDDNEALTAKVSGKTFTVNEVGGFDTNNSVVAGFSNDIRFSVVDIHAVPSGGTGITGTFDCGEAVEQAVTNAFGIFVELHAAGTSLALEVPPVDVRAVVGGGGSITGTFQPYERCTQATTNATGIVYYADTVTDILYIKTDAGSAAFSGDNNITGDQSGATWTAGTTATYSDPPAFSGDNDITGLTSGATWDAGTGATFTTQVTYTADLNNGDGLQPYAGAASGDITGAAPETMQNVYQWSKYQARHEEADIVIEGPGTADSGTVGQLYRRLKDTYAEVKPGNPFGVYTGSLAFAQGWFLNTGCIASADIRSFSVLDDNGVSRNPPNLQALTISGVDSGWRVAAYRSTGAGLTTILRNEFDVGTVGAGNNQAGDSTVLVGANSRTVSPLPADVPDSGVLRILSPNNTGNYIRFVYSAVNRTTNIFTLTGTIGSFLTAAGETSTDLVLDDNVHVVFIEEQSAGASVSNTMQYVADIPIVFKARLKGFKPFRSTTNFTSSGGTGGVVQTADTIVDLP